MSDERDRMTVKGLIQAIMEDNPGVGMVFLAFVHEHPDIDGAIELDASFQTGSARTTQGGELIVEFSKRLSEATKAIARDLARETGQEAVDREDVRIPFSGERPKA